MAYIPFANWYRRKIRISPTGVDGAGTESDQVDVAADAYDQRSASIMERPGKRVGLNGSAFEL